MSYVKNLVSGLVDRVYADPLLHLFPSLKAWLVGIHIREQGISVGVPVLVKEYKKGERRGEFRARCSDAVDVDYRQSGGSVERHRLIDLEVIKPYTPKPDATSVTAGIVDIED